MPGTNAEETLINASFQGKQTKKDTHKFKNKKAFRPVNLLLVLAKSLLLQFNTKTSSNFQLSMKPFRANRESDLLS